MTIHLSSAVIHGELSNEIPGLITGMFHLAGSAVPVRLQLQGDFLSDIAGCRVEFSNPLPEALPGQPQMGAQQTGTAGEMTASRRMMRAPRGSGPRGAAAFAGLKNLLFLEWFNDSRQRIVIQSWHWNLRVSAPAWRQTREQEHAQITRSRELRRKSLLDRPRRAETDAAFGPADVHDPFAPVSPASDPFDTPEQEVLPDQPHTKEQRDSFSSAALSAQIAARALAAELCDLEKHLGVVPRVKAREAMLDLLSSIADISAQLRQTMFQIATTKPDCWVPLATDVEQSIPLFSAAGAACDALVNEGGVNHPAWWNRSCARLATIVMQSESLLELLRAD